MPSTVFSVLSRNTVGGGVEFTIVPTPAPHPTTAFVASLNRTQNVSSGSSNASASTATAHVCAVTPGGNVIRRFVPKKSAPLVAVHPAVANRTVTA